MSSRGTLRTREERPPYRNCGRVILGGNRDQADSCVLQAFAAKQPFFVLYDKQVSTPTWRTVWCSQNAKQLTVVHFDGMSCSLPHCAQVDACGAPTITKTKDCLHVKCVNEYDPHAGACLSTTYTYSKYSVHVQCVNEYLPRA
jgi:hypothetical protein